MERSQIRCRSGIKGRVKAFASTLLLYLGLCALVPAAEEHPFTSKISQRIELHDQYQNLQSLNFPATNVTFLTIADRKGSKQIEGWITALKAHHKGPLDIRGLADVGGVPSLLRGRIRKRFQETILYPVMMDWSGDVCARFRYVADQANVIIIDRNGSIAGRFSGQATEASLKAAFVALEKAVATPMLPPTDLATKSPSPSKR